MRYPVYSAQVNDANYEEVQSWYNEVTYTRVQPETGGMEGHVADAYEESLAMFPLMVPHTNPLAAVYPNDGDPSTAAYFAVSSYEEPVDFGLTGFWNLARLIQIQMVEWQEHADNVIAFNTAMSSRVIDDAWITERQIIKPSVYAEEVGTLSWSRTTPKGTELLAIRSMMNTMGNSPNFSIQATPCLMQLNWKGTRAQFQPVEQVDNVLAFYDPDPPELEAMAHELIPGNGMRLIFGTKDTVFPEMDTSGFIPINGNIYWEIQPGIHTVGGTPYAYQQQSVPLIEYDGFVTMSRAQVIDFMFERFSIQNGGVTPTGSTFAATGGGAAFNFTLPYYEANSEFGVVGNVVGSLFTSANISVGGSTLTELTEQFQVYRDVGETGFPSEITFWDPMISYRPKAWDHTSGDCIGYVPYHPDLWNDSYDYILAYAKNPDSRFDGFHFTYKVKISNVTRAWTAEVRNVADGDDPEPILLKRARLIHTRWYDTDTGLIEYDGRDFCTSMVAAEISGLSEDIVGSIEYPGFDWDNYDWPNPTITIPGGTFLLESGSPAPIYPDFTGGLVYDMHLKKWGKMDLEHKAVFDYMAVNTYKPGDQSFTRFGIFGGVLKADGKIYIFDAEPAESYITYGKVGYYRQGMTSPEEVRVHMRNPSDFTVRVSSSIEGKLIEPTFTRSTDFVQTSRAIHYGGYAAKWHNITISGKYDITYLEFRGIQTGKR